MLPPVNIAKIIPPRFPQILRRPRLLERLEQHRDKKLIFILGQAAQGKSTLALSFVNTSKIPSAWLNLGPEDSEAVNLFYLLVQALQRALPEAHLAPLLSYPTLSAGPREEIPLYRDWFLTLLNQVQVQAQVIFDGLDRLAPQASAFSFLQVLLEVAPPNLHLLMLSREMPPLKIQELKIRQEAYIIRNHDLAFTPKETRNYLTNVRQLPLPYDLIVQLHEIAEGWIGGLVLLCETLESLPQESREEFLFQDFREKFKEEVFSYFDERIFSSWPEEMKDFLMKSSILEVVEPDFIKDYMGQENAQEILAVLSGKNLFVQPIFDKQRGWLYRYHQLFQEFLRAKFKEALPLEEQMGAYFRAGSLLEARNELESAVDFYLQSGALAQAVAAMERIGNELLEKGKIAELERWLQRLPPGLAHERPWLLFFQYMIGRFSGSMDSIASLQRALSLFRQQQDTRGLLLASAYHLEASLWLFLDHSSPVAPQVEQSKKLLQGVDSLAFPYESAVLWFQVGWAMSLGCNPRAGYRACRKAAVLARRGGKRHLEINALIRSHFILTSIGEFAAAEEVCQQVDELLFTWTSPELQVLQFLLYGQLKIFRGELAQAEHLVNSAQELVEKHGLTFLLPAVQLYRFMTLGFLGKYAEATEIGSNLLEFTQFAYWNLAVIYYHRGDFPAAQKLAEEGHQVFTSAIKSDLHLSLIRVAAALISYHLDEPESAAERDLQEALQYATAAANHLVLPDIHWVMTLRRWRQGRMGVAAEHIRAGMKIAGQRGSYFSIILSPQDRGRIFTLALELGVEEVWESLPSLLAPLAGWVGPDLELLSRHSTPKIAAKALEIRRMIHRQELPRLEIQTLGGFLLRRDHVSMEDDWEGHQPRLLLKALVAHGGVNVTKDVLLEDLWPESSPEISERNFRVNLHRLRKTLEPNLDKTFGSSYLHTENGMLSLDRELCWVDVDEFLSFYAEGQRQEEQGNLQQALSQFKKAIAIYSGDFLSEELYLPWAETRRSELWRTSLELLERVAQLYERQGSLTKAIHYYKKIIQMDPVSEPTYRRLMTLYANRGMRSEALRIYEACKKVLAKELDAEPDEVTTAMFRKIKESS